MPITIGLVDDHILVRRAIANLFMSPEFEVIVQADNGQQFIHLMDHQQVPDVLLLDINMPVMDGYATAEWLKAQYPDCRIMVLSMNDDEHSVIRMIRLGARGYIVKDAEPQVLFAAIRTLYEKGFYHSELTSARLFRSVQGNPDGRGPHALSITPKELGFLQLSCTELTYKEVADKLKVSPRTVDGYREDLFSKFQVKSRVGLALYAIKNGLVRI